MTTVSKPYRLSALHKFCFHSLEVSAVPVNAMKAKGRVEAQLHSMLTSAMDGGEWSASRPGYFTLEERAPREPPGTHLVLINK